MKKSDIERNEKLAEACYLCVMVNNHTNYCVFLNLSGHVSQISFSVRESKTAYQRVLVEDEFYFDEKRMLSRRLDKVIGFLTEILENNRINYSKLKAKGSHTTYSLFR